MKTSILFAALLAAVVSSAHAASTATFTHRHRAPENRRKPSITDPQVTGVIPRAIRGGHPLEMLNPFAAPKYGTAEESVSLDPNVPGKGQGIKFFSITF
jgi:hypothetical protein